jgi:hypothetical protein
MHSTAGRTPNFEGGMCSSIQLGLQKDSKKGGRSPWKTQAVEPRGLSDLSQRQALF